MAIVKRQADVKLNVLTSGAPVEFDTFSEVADELAYIREKLDLITVTNNINLDELIDAFSAGTVTDFETSLVTDASQLPEGTVSLSNIGNINDFEMSLIN